MLVILKCEEYDSGKCFGALSLAIVESRLFAQVLLRNRVER